MITHGAIKFQENRLWKEKIAPYANF